MSDVSHWYNRNMEESKAKQTRHPFNPKDWMAPIFTGILGSSLFVAAQLYLCDMQLKNLSKDMSDISITFAFTFLGFLISAYAILQTVVQGLPDPESLKKLDIPREEKFRRRAKIRLMNSSLFNTFKSNLLRIAFLSLVFLLLSIGLKPVIYLESNIALYLVNTFEMFGIVFIATAGYTNLKTLFALI